VFESARTHEAVQLPASVADLDTALAKVDRNNFAHGFGRRMDLAFAECLQRFISAASKKKLRKPLRETSALFL
jgi:hypothetical protein